MASSREVKAVSSVLSDEENAELTAEEVAERAIAALDRLRLDTHRWVALFQVVRPTGEPSWPFVVGPFTTYLQALRACEWYGQQYDSLTAKGYKHRRMVGVSVANMKEAAEICDSHFVNAKEDTGGETVKGLIKRKK